jgi:hypothetical protein
MTITGINNFITGLHLRFLVSLDYWRPSYWRLIVTLAEHFIEYYIPLLVLLSMEMLSANLPILYNIIICEQTPTGLDIN